MVFVLVLKVDKLHCSVVFQNVDLQTSIAKEYAIVKPDQLNVFEDGAEAQFSCTC